MSQTLDHADVVEIPDLSDPASFGTAVPHDAFAELVRRPGLHWVPTTVATANGGFWAVTRYDEIVEIEKDPATFTSMKGMAYPLTNITGDHPYLDEIMFTDPPRHNYLRRAAAKGFAPRIVAKFEPWIREIVTEVIDGIADRAQFDFVEEFARTIPAYVIATVLGSPREDRKYIVDTVTAYFDALMVTEDLEEGEGGAQSVLPHLEELMRYAEKMQKVKLAEPGDDMFTELARVRERGEINQSEYLQWMHVMIAAGFETTHTAIGQSMRMYLEDPEIAALTDRAIDEGHTERLVEEYLRLITPPMQMARTATRDVVISGQQIRENDVVVMYYVAANRDPAVYSDPDRFDPWRAEVDSLTFGTGPHRCIGAHLAMLELQILWQELRARGIKLELDGEPRRGYSNFINQLTELPVRRVMS
ncbi:cytochrome P450 [Nocardia xishanensis]|uniref:cytochrome P450 n=1 Tax=Nocardia xishanensis TaxID=238964 RepID=UPI00082CFE17|nr:cytochrome P450 [Nocardia xishanensis]